MSSSGVYDIQRHVQGKAVTPCNTRFAGTIVLAYRGDNRFVKKYYGWTLGGWLKKVVAVLITPGQLEPRMRTAEGEKKGIFSETVRNKIFSCLWAWLACLVWITVGNKWCVCLLFKRRAEVLIGVRFAWVTFYSDQSVVMKSYCVSIAVTRFFAKKIQQWRLRFHTFSIEYGTNAFCFRYCEILSRVPVYSCASCFI